MMNVCKLQPFEGGNGRYSFFVPKQALTAQSSAAAQRRARLQCMYDFTAALPGQPSKVVKAFYIKTHLRRYLR
jgi:hypothetical protein